MKQNWLEFWSPELLPEPHIKAAFVTRDSKSGGLRRVQVLVHGSRRDESSARYQRPQGTGTGDRKLGGGLRLVGLSRELCSGLRGLSPMTVASGLCFWCLVHAGALQS